MATNLTNLLPAGVPNYIVDGSVKTVSFQMFIPSAIADTEGDDAFQEANGTTYVYSGPTIDLSGLHARLGTLNLTGTQPSISQIKIGGVNLLTGAQEIDSAAGVNKDISTAIGASNTLTDGDRIEIATTPGSLETAAAVLAVAFVGVIA